MERFTKVRNIGKGNMGACTLARNNEDGRSAFKAAERAKREVLEASESLVTQPLPTRQRWEARRLGLQAARAPRLCLEVFRFDFFPILCT